MAKYTVRTAEGEYLATYNHLSEVDTFLMHSFPGHKRQAAKGKKAQSVQVHNDEGKLVAYVDMPAVDEGNDM